MASNLKCLSFVRRIFICGRIPEPADQEAKPNPASEARRSDAGPSNYAEASDIRIPAAVPPVEELGADERVHTVALASAVAAEAAAVAAQAAAEVFRLTTGSRVPRKPQEELAAVKIQAVFRGYLAKRKFRALKGLVRLKNLVDGSAVERQTISTLHSMQMLARTQIQIHSRRAEMKQERMAAQRKLQLTKSDRELKTTSEGDKDWHLSHRSKEQVEADLKLKQEAANRRERTLAYAFSHQWKNPSIRTVIPSFDDPDNLQWGWSWLEQWIALAAWESTSAWAPSAGLPVSRLSSRYLSSDPVIMASRLGSVTKPTLPPASDSFRRTRWMPPEFSRRHSISELSDMDAASQASTPPLPGYMQATVASRARSRVRGPSVDAAGAENRSESSARKRLSFSSNDNADALAVPAPGNRIPAVKLRRHSDPSALLTGGEAIQFH